MPKTFGEVRSAMVEAGEPEENIAREKTRWFNEVVTPRMKDDDLSNEDVEKARTEFFGFEEEAKASKVSAFQKRIQDVEAKISGRKSAFDRVPKTKEGLMEMQFPQNKRTDLLGGAIRGAEGMVGPQMKSALAASDIYGQLSESPAANMLIEAMKNPVDTGKGIALSGIASPNMIDAALKGITGEKRGEYGDVYRILGVPEPVAKILGVGTSMIADPFTLKQQYARHLFKGGKGKVAKWKAKEPARSFTEFVSDRRKEIVGEFDELKFQARKKGFDPEVDKLTNRLEVQNIEMDKQASLLDNELQLALEKDALKVKPVIKRNMSKNSKLYKKELDDVSNRLIKNGDEVPNEKMSVVLERSLEEAEDAGITSGAPYNAIKKMMKKYGWNEKEGVWDVVDQKQFKEMVGDMRTVRDSVPKSVREGRSLAGSEEHVASIFQKNFGSIIADHVPEFKGLQKRYSKVIDVNKHANKVFEVFKGELDTNTGEKFLRKAVEGKLSGEERRLVERLQKGVPGFGEGIGDLAKQSREVQKNVGELAKGRLGIRQATATKKAELLGRKELSKQTVANETRRLDKAKDKALQEFENTARLAKRHTEKMAKSNSSQNWIKGIGGSILIYELVTRPIRRFLFNKEQGN